MSAQLGLYDLYGGVPPHERSSGTSRAAAISVTETAGTLRSKVLAHVRSCGPAGATCDEVEEALGLRHQTASARMRELALKSMIVMAGERRVTRSGRYAEVWIGGKP